jgi:hypothetical protein
MEPKQLIAEAEAAEQLARIVSYKADKDWLTAKARALRHEAQRADGVRHPVVIDDRDVLAAPGSKGLG